VRELGETWSCYSVMPTTTPAPDFGPASAFGIQAPFGVNDENMMAIVLDESRPEPTAVIHYPGEFGI
jgi:predicted N-acetyltransferase YhbS